jgi:hypothetical protein
MIGLQKNVSKRTRQLKLPMERKKQKKETEW